MIRTFTSQLEWFDNYVSSSMATLGVTTPDADGDLPIRGQTSAGWVHVESTTPYGARVYAYAAVNVPEKVAVLKEINAANLADRNVRVVLTLDGTVVVDYLLFADAVNKEALRRVIRRVLKVADRLGPVLTTLHGGSVPLNAPSATAED